MAKSATREEKKKAPKTGDPMLDKKIEDLVKYYAAEAERSIRESFEEEMERDIENEVKARLKKLKLDEDTLKKVDDADGKLTEAGKKLSDAEKLVATAEEKLKEANDRIGEAEKKEKAATEALAEAKKLSEETAEKLKQLSDKLAAAPASGDAGAPAGVPAGRPGVLDYLAAMTDDEKKKFFAVADTLDEKAEQSSKLSRLFR